MEAPHGFCAVLSDSPHPERLTDGWGDRWEIMSSGFNPYPCGVVTHAAIEAALALRNEQGVTADLAAQVHARCHPLVLEFASKSDPHTGLEAKFSIYHCLAAALVDGAVTLATFTDQRVSDPTIAAMRQRIRVEVDPSLQTDQAQVTAKLITGQEMSVVIEHAGGSPAHPLTDGQLMQKFNGLVEGCMDTAVAQEVREQVYRLETLPDVTRLLRLCRK